MRKTGRFFQSFSRASRYTGKEPLDLKMKLQKLKLPPHRLVPGHWTTDQLARTLLLLGLAERDKQEFLDKLDKLLSPVTLAESVALYQSLAGFALS